MAEELDRDNPLFNDEVQVQVKFPDHDKTFSLTVRVLQGSRVAPVGSGGGQREGVLHIEITDELDPFFLYTLQVCLPPTIFVLAFCARMVPFDAGVYMYLQ